jgi:hypothetical protein
MLDKIITSETRVKLLLKFFLNPNTRAYLRQLAKDFNESTNGIRIELNRLSEAKILTSYTEGRNKIYKANASHPLFEELRNIVLKSTGIDKVISDILKKIGKLELAFIRGDYATGKDSGLIDLILVGDGLNMTELERVRVKTEILIGRKISTVVLYPTEYENLKMNFDKKAKLVLFESKKSQNE